MILSDFKCRASSCSKIATRPKSKKELLSVGAKTYLQELANDEWAGLRLELDNKYVNKGTAMEDEAIEAAKLVLKLPFELEKNERYFESKLLKGTPDLILKKEIIDIKCSWDHTTFPRLKKECPNKDYYWQLQAYMALTGKRSARLVYVLLTTPEWIKEGEPNYNHIPIKERVKVFEIKRNQIDINFLYQQSKRARRYYDGLLND